MENSIREYIQLVKTIERAKREGRTGELLQTLKEQEQIQKGRTDELVRAAKENAEIQKIMMRPRRHATINGAGEIGMGMFLLCMALSSYTSVFLPNSPWRNGVSFLLLFCGSIVMPLCLWGSNKYVTRPRIGYVAFRREKSRWVGMIVGMVVAAGVSIGLVSLMRPEITHLAQS